jgi:hypothetical protein
MGLDANGHSAVRAGQRMAFHVRGAGVCFAGGLGCSSMGGAAADSVADRSLVSANAESFPRPCGFNEQAVLTDVVRRLASVLAQLDFGRRKPPPELGEQITPRSRPKVLVVGVYMGDRHNLIDHLVPTLAASRHCQITQRWIAIGSISTRPDVAAVTLDQVHERTPKFTLVNRLISEADIAEHDYIMVCDDDVRLPADFTDRFIGWQLRCDFALAQPARTWNSYIDHSFVRRSMWSKARETRFVEIGPIFCMSQTMAKLLVPFDETSAMGWGYDLVWPVIAKRHGLKLGIVDDAAIDHSIRARGALYQTGGELESMAAMLSQREHLKARDAFVVLQRFR